MDGSVFGLGVAAGAETLEPIPGNLAAGLTDAGGPGVAPTSRGGGACPGDRAGQPPGFSVGATPAARLRALNSCAMMATSLGFFQPSMPSFQTWTDFSGPRLAMYLAASAQLKGPFSMPSTATYHSLRATVSRPGSPRPGTVPLAGTVPVTRAGASCSPATTSPEWIVMTLPHFLHRMRTMRCLILSSAME